MDRYRTQSEALPNDDPKIRLDTSRDRTDLERVPKIRMGHPTGGILAEFSGTVIYPAKVSKPENPVDL